MSLGLIARVLGVLAAVAYPLAIYAGLTWWSTRAVSCLILAFVVPSTLLRLRGVGRDALVDLLSAPLGVVLLVVFAFLLNDARFILVMPVLVNAVLFATFYRTLKGGESMIERYARLVDPELSPDQVAHCRQVTGVWCGFFVANGTISGMLGMFAPPAWWALYTGLLSYVLMGGLFAAEFVARKARFRRYGSGLHDRVLAQFFPPTTAVPASAAGLASAAVHVSADRNGEL
jgi:uncharacterized membrane protein